MRFEELITLLKTADTVEAIDERREEIAGLIPKVRIMFGFDQMHETHQYDLWFHTLHVVTGLERNIPDDQLYLAALLHDIGKPDCQIIGRKDDPGVHYYGHPHRSMQIVRDEILPDLAAKGIVFTDEERGRLLFYVDYHDERVAITHRTVKHILKKRIAIISGGPAPDDWLRNADYEEQSVAFHRLMLLQVSDAKAHVTSLPKVQERIRVCQALAQGEGDRLIWDLLHPVPPYHL